MSSSFNSCVPYVSIIGKFASEHALYASTALGIVIDINSPADVYARLHEYAPSLPAWSPLMNSG